MAEKVQSDPIVRFSRWLTQARKAGNTKAEAAALATADQSGYPSVRFVLLKATDSRGFIFYTDTRSEKGQNLRSNPHASMALYWDETEKQVRISGRVEPVSEADADEYWRSRPRASRISATVSTQSAILESHGALLSIAQDARRNFRRRDIPRPAYWRGFRIVPERIEFWTQGPHRLHKRELFQRAGEKWKCSLLQP